MEEKIYPDVSHIFAAKEERRRHLAALSWEEKVAIIEKMNAAMPRRLECGVALEETEAQKLKRYRMLIKQILNHYAEEHAHATTAELIPVFDERNANYLLVALAPKQFSQPHTTLLHLRIKGNCVVIELDRTEEGIRRALIVAGIPEAMIKPNANESIPRYAVEEAGQ
jgi:hypothetical protein